MTNATMPFGAEHASELLDEQARTKQATSAAQGN
jgi:hypothetical protein